MDTRDRRAWYVISLRPQGEHAALRDAAKRHGARLLALSPWKLQARDDDATRARLRDTLACDAVVFTSPAAVKFAQALQPLRANLASNCIAVGAGTARALQRVGVEGVQHPQRMDSEGVLALPALLQANEIGLVTAPGGRDLITQELHSRGARVLRADVYTRVAIPLSSRALQSLRALDAPAVVLISSAEALQALFAQLDDADRLLLLRHPAVVASARLRECAHQLGFARIAQAEGPRPAQLLEAASRIVENL